MHNVLSSFSDSMQAMGFDNDLYLKLQSERIKERIQKFWGKLYLEFWGKLFDDYHASRVLPWFHPDSKIKMLSQLKDDVEIIIAINAQDIERNKLRGDFWISYDVEVLRLIDAFREYGLYVWSVCITRFTGQSSAIAYQKKLESLGVKVYHHYPIAWYPSNIPMIVSDEGYGKNDYIETTKSLVVVTAPWPWSGKMATCLSQIYHEFKRGIKAWYAKYETFPIWNLPLTHPTNLAYEAATVDLNDVNMIDPFHLEAYGETTVNYNRDIEIFPVLNAMFEKIMGESPYKSPTDMGVNMAWKAIINDEIVRQASRQEIIRRYFQTLCQQKQGSADESQILKLQFLMKQAETSIDERPIVSAAKVKTETTGNPAMAIALDQGNIVTGKTSSLLNAPSAMLLNALKKLAWIDDDIKLISETILEPIQNLKINLLKRTITKLHPDEVLIALSICAVTDEKAKLALDQISKLRGTEAHSTVILSENDTNLFKKLGINLTCDPEYQTKKLYHK